MGENSFRMLLHGIDTVQCAYYLKRNFRVRETIDFKLLAQQKEAIRQSRKRDLRPVVLGNTEFFLHPYGSSSGYPLIISNRDFKIEMGALNMPNFFVTFSSEALWRESAFVLHEKFMQWVCSVGYEKLRDETLSRVDFCFDYKLPEIDFNEDSFVSYSKKDSKHRECAKVQTFTFGRDDIVLRVYDKVAEINQKSDKVWFYTLWEEKEDVWRIEWQVRKSVLRNFGICTFDDLQKRQGNLLYHLAYEHDTLRVTNEDSNRSRWPLHPLWKDIQVKIDALYSLPVYKVIGEETILDERMMQIAIAIYGYLKRVAAIYCVQRNVEQISTIDAIDHISKIMVKFHEPLAWRLDVEKRKKEIKLGKW